MGPPLSLESLGDPGFKSDHGLRFAYICGAMANGITSTAMVEAASRSGMLAFFGAGGLSIEQITSAIDTLQASLGDRPYGFNLIHSPNDMALEQKTVDLYLARGVHLVSASAYLDLTTPLVQYRVHGIHRNDRGQIVCPNRIIAKVSREEVARKFFSPPADKHLQRLLERGKITADQAELARRVPMAQDLTAEADSGGHTDNRPALCLFPTMKALRNEMTRRYDDGIDLRVGLAGGIATPESAAAALAMGAAYILTGSSINPASKPTPPRWSRKCWPSPARRISSWHRRRTCSRWGSRFRCSSGAPCSPCGAPSSMTSTGPMTASRMRPRASVNWWRSLF
jgi:trans-AT polyketide synthase/acyltransferase/oxidoreductase domain-containing protein